MLGSQGLPLQRMRLHAGTAPLGNQHKLSPTQPFSQASSLKDTQQSQALILSVSTSVTSTISQLHGPTHLSHQHTNYLIRAG